MADEKPSTEGIDSEHWSRNPRIVAALLSGGFAILTAILSGFFAWINRPPLPAPFNPSQVVQEQSTTESREPASTIVEPLQTVSIDHSTTPTDAVSTAWTLNFSAFQAAMKDPAANQLDKDLIVRECSGRRVVWKGYVESVSLNTQGDSAATITLCESPHLVTQTMFKSPAYCRFDSTAIPELRSIQTGQPVTIAGTFERHSALGTELSKCSIISNELRHASEKLNSVQ